MNPILKYGKKKVLIVSVVSVLGLAVAITMTSIAAVAYAAEKTLEGITTVFDDTKKVVEYGAKVDTK
ncbi:MAG: hypothetical protein RR516_05060, partial [Erysipelotrichaceae bacterium]